MMRHGSKPLWIYCALARPPQTVLAFALAPFTYGANKDDQRRQRFAPSARGASTANSPARSAPGGC